MGNAKQIPHSESLNLLTFVFIDQMTHREKRTVELLIESQINEVMKKEKNTTSMATLGLDNVSDNGTPHKYTNGKSATPPAGTFKVTKGDAVPFKGAPTVPAQNHSTEKPVITAFHFDQTPTHAHLASGIAYQGNAGFNRNGIGKEVRFVAVKGFGSWALYTGAPTENIEAIADWGDKIVLDPHIKQLVDCDAIITEYRF